MIRTFMPIAVGAATGFQCFNTALDYDIMPAPPGKYAGSDRHKWRNAFTSLLNSAITASIVVYCFFKGHPQLWNSPDTFYSVPTDVCAAVTSGYLMYDTYDLVLHNNFLKVWATVSHHIIMIFILFVISREELAMGILMIGLLCEFSAIFLHSRLLLLIYGFSKRSFGFGVHKIFNLTTFVLLRLVPIAYSCYISVVCDHLPPYLAVSLPPLTGTIFIINCVLVWRLVRSDFLNSSGQASHIMEN